MTDQTPHEELVEAVAKAFYDTDYNMPPATPEEVAAGAPYFEPWEDATPDTTQHEYRLAARAGLAVVAEHLPKAWATRPYEPRDLRARKFGHRDALREVRELLTGEER